MKKFIIIAIVIMVMATAFQTIKAAYAEPGDYGTKVAELELYDITIQKINDRTDVSVVVRNTGNLEATRLWHNMVVYLRVKDYTTGNWRELQNWSEVKNIKAGDTVTFNLSPEKTTDPALRANNFTLQAEIVMKNNYLTMSNTNDNYSNKIQNIDISKPTLNKSYP